MSQESVELAGRSIDAFNLRDLDALRATNRPDIEVDWSRSRGLEAGVYRGQAEVLRFYRTFFDTFDEVVIEVDRLVEAGDSVVVVPNTTHLRGRGGIEISARSAFVFKVQGGLIAEISLYQTLGEALEVAGLSE